MIEVYWIKGSKVEWARFEFNGKTSEGHYKLDSYNGWEFILTKDKRYITNHNDETFEVHIVVDPFSQLKK